MLSEPRDWAPVCSASTLEAAGRLERMIGRRPVLLFWLDGRAHAVDALCPHAAAPLAQGYVEDGRLHCPGHRASFDLTNGSVDPGWKIEPLGVHAARERDGQIEVRLQSSCAAALNGGSSDRGYETKA